jgi:hypothetical protein
MSTERTGGTVTYSARSAWAFFAIARISSTLAASGVPWGRNNWARSETFRPIREAKPWPNAAREVVDVTFTVLSFSSI